MKKIIIISYFYPPCNLTASQRIHAFARYLPKFGFYPIIITRNWELNVKNQYDITQPSGKEVIHKKYEQHEVYYLPFKGSKRDVFLKKFGKNRYPILRKLLTFREMFLEKVERFPAAWMLMYHKSKELMQHGDIDYLLISGNPFWQFYFGYLLKIKFPTLKWIADYRDDWTTGELGKKHDLASKIINNLSIKNEKKWLQNASLVTSVSAILSQRIGDNVGVPSKTIANGFFHENVNTEQKPHNPKEFIITYTGYLYGQQRIEWFIAALKNSIDKYQDDLLIKIQFIGSAFEKASENRIKKLMEGYEKNLRITERLSREDSIQEETASDLLLMVAYRDLKGIPGSKLYQYIGNQRPVFLCPSDNDIVENILEETGLGIFCYSEQEAIEKLDNLIEKHINAIPID